MITLCSNGCGAWGQVPAAVTVSRVCVRTDSTRKTTTEIIVSLLPEDADITPNDHQSLLVGILIGVYYARHLRPYLPLAFGVFPVFRFREIRQLGVTSHQGTLVSLAHDCSDNR
jgi:hypothetical protein